MSEAAVFGFVGVSAEHYVVYTPFSWQFVLAGFFIVIIGRTAAIYISYYIFVPMPVGSRDNRLSLA